MSEKHLLVIDWSNILSMCWYPALDAEEAGKSALAEHVALCHICIQTAPCASTSCDRARAIKQYDPNEVLIVNLDGKMGTLREELDKYGLSNFQTVFVEDRYAKAKFALYPEYKGERDKSKPKPPRELAKAHLKSKGYQNWVHSPDYEADDAIAAFVAKASKREMPTIIISGDKDLWQLLNPPLVAVFNPYTNRFVDTQEDVPKKFNGISDPRLIPLVKSLWGDTSDNIPNVVPRMQKHLVPLIEDTDGSIGSFEFVWNNFGSKSARCTELVEANLPLVKRNYELVKLNPNCPLVFDDISQ